MAFTIIEGFDLAGSNSDLLKKGAAATQGTLNTTGGRFGGGAYEVSTTSDNCLSYACTTQEYLTISFYYKNGDLSTDAYIFTIQNGNLTNNGTPGSYSHFSLYVGVDGKLSTYENEGNLKGITSASGLIQSNTWHHIEVKVRLNSSSSCIINVDDAEVLNISGVDFYDSLGETVPYVCFSGDSSVNTFDDIVIQQGASSFPNFLGSHRIHTLLPNAGTAQADFTGAYTDIDDPTGTSANGDTDYISSSTVGHKSEFDFENLPESPSSIYAVQTVTEARKDDPATRTIKSIVKSGASSAQSTSFGLSETYAIDKDIQEVDPDTAAAWSESGVNNMKVGVEIAS